MKNVIIHNDAELELWQNVAYYENKCTGLGLDFKQEVSKVFQDIQIAPKKGTIKKYGTRSRTLIRFPFVVYYLERKTDIWIIAIAHKKRELSYWKDRFSDKDL